VVVHADRYCRQCGDQFVDERQRLEQYYRSRVRSVQTDYERRTRM